MANVSALYGGFKKPSNTHRTAGQTSVVYFLQSHGLLKIGIAQDLDKRMGDYRLHNPGIGKPLFRTVPRPLARQTEKMIHAALAPHAKGREWFDLPVSDALAIATPIINRAARIYSRMDRDGMMG